MSDQPRFQLHLEPSIAKCKVLVNDVDVSGAVKGVSVDYAATVGTSPQVILELTPGFVDIEGLGDVAIVDSRNILTDLLDELNPQEIEAEALQRTVMGQSTTAAVFEIIKERAGVTP
jgi:hypothetical protein